MKFETPQPSNVDDLYHILELSSILLVKYWDNFLALTSALEGDYVEFGVGRSKSLLIVKALQTIAHQTQSSYHLQKRAIWAFDSFQGFPEPNEHDMESTIRQPRVGEWSSSPNQSYEYTVSFSKQILKHASVKPDNVTYIPGFFQETHQQYPKDRKIAILHLDGDLYESYVYPLHNLYEQVVPGGLIVIDDFYHPKLPHTEDKFPGARRAVSEFLEIHPELHLQTSIRGTPFIQKPLY